MEPLTVEVEGPLTPRWRPMLMHPERRRMLSSKARHRVVAAGRRSGKTEDAKRIIIAGDDGGHSCCLTPPAGVPNPRFGVFGPTHEQVRRNWWDDLKRLSPPWAVRKVIESPPCIEFVTGAKLYVMGLDKPQRAEGDAFDGIVVDECAEIKEQAWDSSLRPTLSNRGRPPGWSLRIGRPKGRNHFHKWYEQARTTPGHAAFHWPSSIVLPPEEIEAAQREYDELSYRQEYEADFVNFEGLAYYQFSRDLHCREVTYDPRLPLIFAFDFNIAPGVAAVLQEQALPGKCKHGIATGQPCRTCGGILVAPVNTTCVIGEVCIPVNSNTPRVCNKLAQDWGHHKGDVLYYGDATGGHPRSSQTDGTDWDLVRQYLKPHFGDRLKNRVARSNPAERERVNELNSRLLNQAGEVRLLVNAQKAPNVVRDFEGVILLKGGSGEIDKDNDESLTHLTDAIGYYVHEKHPIGGHVTRIGAM